MRQPAMFIVAGPPGSGKSSRFPVNSFGVAFFNADDRAAQLNGGSFASIPKAVRRQVNQEFEPFILDHIERRTSFAIETTLRSTITFEQACLARQKGFRTAMYYVALRAIEENIARIIYRAKVGGHSAPQSVLRLIHRKSLENLSMALRFPESGIELLRIFDNSSLDFGEPREVFRSVKGVAQPLVADLPAWLQTAVDNV